MIGGERDWQGLASGRWWAVGRGWRRAFTRRQWHTTKAMYQWHTTEAVYLLAVIRVPYNSTVEYNEPDPGQHVQRNASLLPRLVLYLRRPRPRP